MEKEEIERLTAAQKFALVENGNVFCWKTFKTKLVKKVVNFFFDVILSAEFLVWVFFTIPFFHAMFRQKLWKEIFLWLIYAGISIIFIIARSVRIVLEQKTTLEIKAQATASATAAITGSISELTGKVVDKIKGEK